MVRYPQHHEYVRRHRRPGVTCFAVDQQVTGNVHVGAVAEVVAQPVARVGQRGELIIAFRHRLAVGTRVVKLALDWSEHGNRHGPSSTRLQHNGNAPPGTSSPRAEPGATPNVQLAHGAAAIPQQSGPHARCIPARAQNGVAPLDVRLNNTSQLSGFAKRDDLAWFLDELGGIDYLHLPSLAPTRNLLSDYRKQRIDWDTYAARFLDLMRARRVEETIARELLDAGCLLCSEHQRTAAIAAWSPSTSTTAGGTFRSNI